jgi:hypothetical protein
MRSCQRRTPIPIPLFPPFACCNSIRRAAHLPSSAPTPANHGDVHSTAHLTDFASSCQHGPTARLAQKTASSSPHPHKGNATVLPVPSLKVALPQVRLTPTAAALLTKRACDSVVQQEMCATDLLYLMTAEVYAARGQQAGHAAFDAGDEASSTGEGGTSSQEQQQQLAFAAAPCSASLDARERQLADFMTGRVPLEQQTVPVTQGSSNISPTLSGLFDDVNRGGTAFSSLFRQQQELFTLRRRLAYVLADDHTAGECVGRCKRDGKGDNEEEEEGPPLAALGRRTALVLSLARDILSISAGDRDARWIGEGEEEEAEGESGKARETRDAAVRGQVRWADGDCGSDGVSAALSPATAVFSNSKSLYVPARCAFVYRSLAQPVELGRGEAEALLTWCASHVSAYADAVTKTIRQGIRGSASEGEASYLSKLLSAATGEKRKTTAERLRRKKEGGDIRAETPKQGVPRTSGVNPPPTLRLVAQQAATHVSVRHTVATDGGQSKHGLNPSEPLAHSKPISPEVCESVLTAVTALMEFFSAFAHMSARFAVSISLGVVEADRLDRPGSSSLAGDGHGGEECDYATLLCGQVVRSAVDAVCDALRLFHQSGMLERVVAHVKHVAFSPSLSSDNEMPKADTFIAHSAAGTPSVNGSSTMQLWRCVHNMRLRLSFTEASMEHVLCCARESWSQAWELMEEMEGWNAQLRHVLTTPSGRSPSNAVSPVSADGGGATSRMATDAAANSPEASPAVGLLRSQPTGARCMLLYILAQHGRLAEVLDLCQDGAGVSVEQLLDIPQTARGQPPAAEAVGSAAATSALALQQLLVHLAAANADPEDAAVMLLSITRETLGAPPLSRCTQADCVEAVVRAGEMPQRVLGVTEYATLLRRMLGERLPLKPQPQSRGCACSDDADRAAEAAQMAPSGGGSVGWWLSPSQVWRFSAGYPHHVRTTLCLMGFQATARPGVVTTLTMEDVYVVLSISRQLATRQQRDARELLRAFKLSERKGGPTTDVNAIRESGAATKDVSDAVRHTFLSPRQRQGREQRWANWGVEECVWSLRNTLQRQTSSPPTHGMWTSQSTTVGKWEAEARLHLPLLARRVKAPYSARYMESLCAAFAAVQRGVPLLPDRCRSSHERSATRATATVGSAVLLSLLSREMLRLLKAVSYTQYIGCCWETALRTVAVSSQVYSTNSRGDGVAGLVGRRTAESVAEEVAYALAQAAESSMSESHARTTRFVAPLPFLAPYLSTYTVGALVQRPLRRALAWEQCLTLLPYAPLGSRSQLWLLRRVAQEGEGNRRAFAEHAATQSRERRNSMPAPATPAPCCVSTFSQTAAQTAERMIEVQHNARRLHSRTQRREGGSPSPSSFSSSTDSMTAAATTGVSTTPHSTPSAVDFSGDADAALLTLLLEGHWSRALRVFEQASPRVRVAGAPHVVRLLICADVWRDMADAQRRPLVRLAVQSSAHAGSGGASALLEEVLQTTLERGLWHTGLYFHQCVAAEQPELLRQCRRAQVYAAQLCRGLLERTSMTMAVAQLTKAARQSQWAQAAACFMRYATRSDGALRKTGATLSGGAAASAALQPRFSHEDGTSATAVSQSQKWKGGAASSTSTAATAAASAAAAIAVPPTSIEELCALTALMNGDDIASSDSQRDPAVTPPSPSTSRTAAGAIAFFAEDGSAVPAELAHVAHTVRYAILHTPCLWMHALRWLPTATLPLPYNHEVSLRVLCAQNPAKLQALLPHRQVAATTTAEVSEGRATAVTVVSGASVLSAVSAATSTALSVVAEARRVHRPQHPNEVVKEKQLAVASALRVLQHASAWEEAVLLYEKAVESNCMPYGATTAVLETAVQGGAPWQVTLFYFFHMAQRLRPNVAATAVALQACAEGGQWALAFRVLQQSVLTQATPVPRLVELAVSTALHCGVWARALAAAQQYRRTRDPRLAHTVLLTFVCTQHWDDAVEYFYECTRRGVRPLDASLELAIIASEAASEEYRKTALMVGTIASALEDLYRLSGTVLEHILFVQRHARHASSTTRERANSLCRVAESGVCEGGDGAGVFPLFPASSERQN